MSSFEQPNGQAVDMRNLESSATYYGVAFDANDVEGTRARVGQAVDMRNLESSAE